ncbi:hypothetical protein EJO68_11505 [Variovorax atrisoli]|uniref:hypothetical protein n=1 Tax=Variovorax atrisoli TaxID=3394203 RepID=UPI000F7ED2BC|nr:hypothetical protein [Variovorax sp. 369]RTD94402.1 hypothetical protein EJO68_11505 [Variovorax sp. 369]
MSVVNEIDLYPEDFAGDLETHSVAVQVATHVELRRAELRRNPAAPSASSKSHARNVPLVRRAFWGDLIPWFELMAEPAVLDHCARDCAMTPADLADVLADRIRPPNYQVFLWMAQAMRSRDWAARREEFGARLVKSVSAQREAERAGRSKGGKKSGITRGREAKCPPDRLMRDMAELLAQGRSRGEIAGILAPRYGVSKERVRQVRNAEEKRRNGS